MRCYVQSAYAVKGSKAARPHSSFGGKTPYEVYAIEPATDKTEKQAA